MAVNVSQQVAVFTFGCGVKKLHRLKHDGGWFQFEMGGLQIAKKTVGSHGIGIALAHLLEALFERIHIDQRCSNSKTCQQIVQKLSLDGPGHHRNTLVAQVGDGLNGDVMMLVDLRPAQQRRRFMKIKLLRPLFAEGHVGQQVDITPGQFVQAGLPLTPHAGNLPMLASRHRHEHVAQNAAGLTVLAQQQLGRVFVDTNPDQAR